MDSISISRGNTESAVSEMVRKIETEIIGESEKSKEKILAAIERSSGEFIDALKEGAEREAGMIRETGELLIAVVKYIESAAGAFADVDQAYSASKIQ